MLSHRKDHCPRQSDLSAYEVTTTAAGSPSKKYRVLSGSSYSKMEGAENRFCQDPKGAGAEMMMISDRGGEAR